MNEDLPPNDENTDAYNIEDLQKFIQDLEQRGVKDASLATLYYNLGHIYRKRLEHGEFQDYQKEQDLGIEYLSKAVECKKN